MSADESRAEAEAPASPPDVRNLGRPWPPRVYDVLTGGWEGYAADRQFARQAGESVPWLKASMWINRTHRTKAGLVLTRELGIRQIIDLGCGYDVDVPSFQTARTRDRVLPGLLDVVNADGQEVRVLHADIDDFVVGYAQTFLDVHEGTRAVKADARDIPGLLSQTTVLEFLDLDRPIGVLLHDVLPWLSDEEAACTLQSLHELLPAHSALSLTHATGDHDPDGMAALAGAYAHADLAYRPRTQAAISELLGAWTLLEPGIAPTARWRADQAPHIPGPLQPTWTPPPDDSHAYAAVTAPKTTAPEPPTVTRLLSQEPARTPGCLLAGATLQVLRQDRAETLHAMADRLTTPALAIGLWEAGSERLAHGLGTLLAGLDLAAPDARLVLTRLMASTTSSPAQVGVSDLYHGNRDRAYAALRASTRVRALALDRIPVPFRVPGPDDARATGPAPLPPIAPPRPQDSDSCSWHLVLDEAALHRSYSRPGLLAEQLDHLLHLDALPHITVRILPCDSPLDMPPPSLIEHTLTGGTLWRTTGPVYHGPATGEPYRHLMDQAQQHARPEAETRDLLRTARDRLRAAPVLCRPHPEQDSPR
ncbi:Scr1 family TA system antitoxin-like transcriptional regulator [Streptomyces qinglanensis]|uniref:Scr1 family TA system antitoxin-like transcriptional regulator n=1 Tax=Streptomyces qinglanensis TaxID=943816 RepID=UPI003D7444D3